MKNSGTERQLTTDEIHLAQSVFGEKIDYSKVRISNSRATSLAPQHGGCCLRNRIHISGSAYLEDYAGASKQAQGFFIHEMTHIWQYQNHPAQLGGKFLKDIMRYRFNYMAKAYNYSLAQDKDFSKYGHEEQACMVQDYFLLLQKAAPTRHCQNKNMALNEKMALYKKALSPHIPFPAYQSKPGPVTKNNRKP